MYWYYLNNDQDVQYDLERDMSMLHINKQLWSGNLMLNEGSRADTAPCITKELSRAKSDSRTSLTQPPRE